MNKLEKFGKKYPFILYPSQCGDGWVFKMCFKPYKPFYGRTLKEAFQKALKEYDGRQI